MLPTPWLGKVAAIGLLLLLLLSSSEAVALTLPNPPDRSAPANNQNGPLQSPDKQSFAGGVLLVKDGSSNQTTSMNKFVARFRCTAGSYTITKQYETEIGESISGPISNDQAVGITQAMNSVRPTKTIGLSMSVRGTSVGFGEITYSLAGITYNVTTYSVWTVTQPSPAAEQRVGYIVVSVPVQLQTKQASPDLSPDCSNFTYALPSREFGAGFAPPDSLAWLYRPAIPTTTPPDGGFAPIITYGNLRVLSGAGVAGAANIRPGENATFLLPPGTYSAVDDVVLFGIPFAVGSGTYSSPPNAAAAQFAVSLENAMYVWYGLEALAAVILVAVIWVVGRKLRIGEVVIRAAERVSHEFLRRLKNK